MAAICVSGVVDRSRSVKRVLYTFSCSIPTRCSQLDSHLANLEATVKLGYIMEFVSSTRQWLHVGDKYFKFHKVV